MFPCIGFLFVCIHSSGAETGMYGDIWVNTMIANALAPCIDSYCQTSNKRRAWVGNKFADPSDVAGALPVGAAPTTSWFST